MHRRSTIAATVMTLLGLGLMVPESSSGAVEIKVLSSANMEPLFKRIAGEFERTSGNKLAITYDTAGPVKNRILAGEVPDMVITQGSFIDDLLKQNKIVPGSRANLALSAVVAFVRAGAPKPDISSVDALKRTLFAARSIAHSDPAQGGAAGVYFAASMDRLGIADQLKPKVKLVVPGTAGETVAKGEAEIGIDQNAVVRPIPGIDIIGSLPRDLKADIMFSAGVVNGAHEQAGATALIKYLSSPSTGSAIKATGLESPANP